MTYPYDGVRSLVHELIEENEYFKKRIQELEKENAELKEQKEQFVKKLKL